METRQIVLACGQSPACLMDAFGDFEPHLVFVFADLAFFADDGLSRALGRRYPNARRIGCSTGGEIGTAGASEGTAVVTAIRLEDPCLELAVEPIHGMSDSECAGERLGAALAASQPRAVLLIGQGVALNGSAVVRGLQAALGGVPVFGGLAGDAAKFERTWVLADNLVSDHHLVALAFGSPRLAISHGAYGGWKPFGPIRQATRVNGNVLHELDGEPALEVYRRYLGPHAEGLPGSALLFPFALLDAQFADTGITRTILGIDATAGSLTLAGDIPDNGYLRLLCATSEDLIGGAESAARAAAGRAAQGGGRLALLVSCVGRRLVLGPRTEEEVEAVAAVLGPDCALMGFYSNGEIGRSPTGPDCLLHNQSMIIAVLEEAA